MPEAEAQTFSVGRGEGAAEVERLLMGNRAFVEGRLLEDADAFRRLIRGQKPPFLLVGCCDSRKPLDLLTRTHPGELFIHRNIANLLPPGDPASEAVLEFAMSVLEVRHIVVSGHTRCGGIHAGLQGLSQGAVGHWIQPLRHLAEKHRAELDAIAEEEERADRLAERNVVAQLRNALGNAAVRRRLDGDGPPLHLHGWMFRVETGFLEPLPLPEEEWRAEGLLPES